MIKKTSFLFFLFAFLLDFICFCSESNKYENVINNYSGLKNELDIGDLPNFEGGYINFGYWDDLLPIKNRKMSKYERIKGSKNLYLLVINSLKIKSTDYVLEVGCGRGYGSAIVSENFKPAQILGIDITPKQIERAIRLQKNVMKNHPELLYKVASDDKTNLPNSSINKIFSVEAAQYFYSMNNFSKEMFRILKPGGKLVITTFFSTSLDGYKEVSKIIPSIKEKIDKPIPIDHVRESLRCAGFNKIKIKSIGMKVFEGYEKWISDVKIKTAWSHNFYKAYKKKYIDYYIIFCEK